MGSSVLWYEQPAPEWKEGLPLGNGRLGAMVIGGVTHERVALNHEWLWRAKGKGRTSEPRHQHLSQIRDLFFAGKLLEAGALANEKLSLGDHRVGAYQPVGDLLLVFPGSGSFSDYRRQLDLAEGIVRIGYRADGVQYTRQLFVSAVHQVLVLRLTSSPHGGPGPTLKLARVEDPECDLVPWAQGARCGFAASFPEGPRFAVEARVLVHGGAVSAAGGTDLHIADAGSALIVLAIATDQEADDPARACAHRLDSTPMDWDVLRAAHVAEHRAMFERVRIDLGPAPDLSTDQRLERLRSGAPDEDLIALYCQFGRYLLMSSSRSCDLPANLQGIWNEELKPPWDSDFHHDVNLQMNYWPAEAANLSECTGPLWDYLERLVPEARKAARDLYDCAGLFVPITSDAWARCTPEAPGWDVWTGAAAWLAQHLWWHYGYTGDLRFLRDRAYPFLKGVAAFYEDFLVTDPSGRLVTVPSQSPENQFVGGSAPVSLCVGATMDLELIHDVLSHAIAGAEQLDVDADLRHTWQRILAQLPPLQIGRHGQLCEWLEDYEEVEPGHRHISHLFGLFPGDQITLEDTPQSARAARVSLERRLAAHGGHTGWSRAWTVCCWARLAEGDLARRHLGALIGDFATNSLLDLHPPRIFQIDGNLGGAAAVTEMLLQSHGGVIRILPALPTRWPEGSVTGLRARGGFEVDITWGAGRAIEVRLRSLLGGTCTLRFSTPPPALSVYQREQLVQVQRKDNELSFSTEGGAEYVIR